MKIKILALGKVKEKYIKDGINEFLKRLSAYTNVEIIEINAISVKDENLIQKVLQQEGEKILPHIKANSFVISLEIEGANFSSEKFAQKIDAISKHGYNEMVFIIGSSHGLAKIISDRADLILSLSKMTFLHEFARLILIEQIYRAFKILKGETYHK